MILYFTTLVVQIRIFYIVFYTLTLIFVTSSLKSLSLRKECKHQRISWIKSEVSQRHCHTLLIVESLLFDWVSSVRPKQTTVSEMFICGKRGNLILATTTLYERENFPYVQRYISSLVVPVCELRPVVNTTLSFLCDVNKRFDK